VETLEKEYSDLHEQVKEETARQRSGARPLPPE
jgi:hypothetical protein